MDKQSSSDPQIQFIANDDRSRLTSPGTEIRVHGVGDHANFSALGRPGFEDRRKSQVVICEPPQLPPHRLLLIGWSRANRRLTRTVPWYLLFPFTLINVAGYMTPRRNVPARLLRASVQLTSLILTVVLAAWVTVIIETVWRGITSAPDGVVTRVLLCVSGSAVVGVVVVHRLRNGTATVNRAGRVCSITHLAALSLLSVVCFFGPANWQYTNDEPRWWRSLHDSTVDPMAYLLVASNGIVLAIVLMLALIAVGLRLRARDRWAARDGSSLAAAALILLVATSVLHTAASLIRLVVGDVIGIVQDIRETVTGEAGSSENMLLPQAEDLTAALRMDLLLGFFVAFVAALALSVFGAAVVNMAARTRSGPADGLAGSNRQPASVWHSILRYTAACLSFVTLSTIVLTTIAWTAMGLRLDSMSTPAVGASRNIISVTGAVVIVFLIVRRPEKAGEWIKGVFQMVADIAGFWSPRSVPLAGASYRNLLMEGLDSAVEQADDGPVVLVGHSQGSVICAWYVGNFGQPQNRITLFTCGSPLWSLYASFFPTYFGDEFFQRVSSNSAGGDWFNYWRLTDPIATALPGARNHDVTEDKTEPLCGHSEYWREPQLRQDINGALAGIHAD